MSTQASIAIQAFELGSCCRPRASFMLGTGVQIGLLPGFVTSTCTQQPLGVRCSQSRHCSEVQHVQVMSLKDEKLPIA